MTRLQAYPVEPTEKEIVERAMERGGGFTDEETAILMKRAEQCDRRTSGPQVEALLAAGWCFELPGIPDPWLYQWYWRRPPRRKGSKGMFFWSTSQAYNALMREKEGK